jgi:hypothetical protein
VGLSADLCADIECEAELFCPKAFQPLQDFCRALKRCAAYHHASNPGLQQHFDGCGAAHAAPDLQVGRTEGRGEAMSE